MKSIPARKGPPPKMKKIMMEIPEDLHTAMKIRAAETKITMKDYMIEAIRQAIVKGGTHKQ